PSSETAAVGPQQRRGPQSLRRSFSIDGEIMIRESATYWINKAYREGWAVGMFNAHHLEAVQAIATAADKARAPVMLSTTMGGIKHVGLDYFVAMAEVARRRTSVPLILHLDHGANYETVRM